MRNYCLCWRTCFLFCILFGQGKSLPFIYKKKNELSFSPFYFICTYWFGDFYYSILFFHCSLWFVLYTGNWFECVISDLFGKNILTSTLVDHLVARFFMGKPKCCQHSKKEFDNSRVKTLPLSFFLFPFYNYEVLHKATTVHA